jgi:hypothetical protein
LALQHFFACLRILLVDFASPVSRNLLTPLIFCRQVLAAHWKVWQWRPPKYSMIGTGLKNA